MNRKATIPELHITPAPSYWHSINGNTNNISSKDFVLVSQHLTEMASVASSAKIFADASERSNGVVILDQRYGCLPVIIGKDGVPVLMYKFVEVLHEIVNLSELQEELPTLSYGQIEGGITFLRALAQFNVRGIDIDAEEEHLLEASPEFQLKIKEALKLESPRVFTVK